MTLIDRISRRVARAICMHPEIEVRATSEAVLIDRVRVFVPVLVGCRSCGASWGREVVAKLYREPRTP